MKNSLTLIFISIFLFSVARPANRITEAPNFYTWKPTERLSWNDFKGKAIENASEVALTASSVEYSYTVKGNTISWRVIAKFFPKESWKQKKIQSDYILQHEQLHFDITELYTRMLRKELTNSIQSYKDAAKIKQIGKKILQLWSEEQNQYDVETNHSINKPMQLEWNQRIKERLDELAEFSSK